MPLRFFSGLFFSLICLFSFSAFAGGPFYVSYGGTGSYWDTAPTISYHPESGSCGPFTQEDMLAKIEEDLGVWSSLVAVDISFDQVSDAIGDLDETNYTTYFYEASGTDEDNAKLADSLNPIIFDETGDIIAAIAGEENRYYILGFAGPTGFSNEDYDTIVDGQSVINCLCLEGGDTACEDGGSTIEYSEDNLDYTIIHEFGHFINLDHSQVNLDLYDDGDTDNDDDIPIMFPIVVDTSDLPTPSRDDFVALGALYPQDTFAGDYCLVTGTLLDADGNELRCADVQAITDDTGETVAQISGVLAVTVDGVAANAADGDTIDANECTSNCGYFELYLTPGLDYTIMVEPIYDGFVGGSGMGPCYAAQLDTIEEEDVASVSSAQCTAGTTLSLGSITTTSTGGVTIDGGSGTGSSGASDGDPYDNYDELNPVGYGCSLLVAAKPTSDFPWELGLVLMGLVLPFVVSRLIYPSL